MRKKLLIAIVVAVTISAAVAVVVLPLAASKRQTAARAYARAHLCSISRVDDGPLLGLPAPPPYAQLRDVFDHDNVLIVRGTVVAARPQQAFLADGQEVDFMADGARRRTIDLDVNIEEGLNVDFDLDGRLSGQPAQHDIVVPVALSDGSAAAVEKLLQGLVGLEAVWVLDGSGQMIDPKPPTYALLEGGRSILPVDDRGRLSLPCPASNYPSGFLSGAATWPALRAIAEASGQPVLVEASEAEAMAHEDDSPPDHRDPAPPSHGDPAPPSHGDLVHEDDAEVLEAAADAIKRGLAEERREIAVYLSEPPPTLVAGRSTALPVKFAYQPGVRRVTVTASGAGVKLTSRGRTGRRILRLHPQRAGEILIELSAPGAQTVSFTVAVRGR